MRDLPKGWLLTEIGEVADAESGSGFPKHMQGKIRGDYPFAKVSDISRAVAQANSDLSTAANYVDEADLKRLRAKPVPTGSIAFAKIGEALRLNRRAKVCKSLVLDNNCMALVPRTGALESSFLYRFMTTVDLSPYAVATAVPSVRKGDVEGIELPLPPLAEQRRIVEKLDALTARTARARADLDRIPRLANSFRRNILSEAFDREDGSKQVRLADVIDVRSGFAFQSAKFLTAGDVPVVRIGDIGQQGVTLTSSTKWLTEDDLDRHSRYIVEHNDVLVALSGATTGKSGVYNQSRPALLNQRVARLRPMSRREADCNYIVLLCEWMGPKVLESAQGGAQPNISPKKIEDLGIYWPDDFERDVLVRRINAQFAELDRLKAEAATASRLLDRLDQAVLAKAFRGELVPQDPSDEPASVLLDRIRAERAAAPKAKRGRRKAAA